MIGANKRRQLCCNQARRRGLLAGPSLCWNSSFSSLVCLSTLRGPCSLDSSYFRNLSSFDSDDFTQNPGEVDIYGFVFFIWNFVMFCGLVSFWEKGRPLQPVGFFGVLGWFVQICLGFYNPDPVAVVQLHLHIVWYICLQEDNCSVWSRTWSSVFCSFLCFCLISQGQLSEFVDYSLRMNLRQMGSETSFALSHSTKNAESWLAHYHTSWWYLLVMVMNYKEVLTVNMMNY